MYLIIDVESTCGEGVPRDQSEIIEIGYIIMNKGMQNMCANYRFVKPVLHPTLTDFCKQLTTISQADIDFASDYATAMSRMAQDVLNSCRMNLNDMIMVSWGKYDRNMFIQCGKQHGFRKPYPFMGHINLKREYALFHHLPAKGMGLQKAVEHSGMTFAGTPHRGMDDANNIAKIMAHTWPTGYTGSMQFV